MDLELNFAVLPSQSAKLADALEPLLRTDVFTDALHPVGAAGTKAVREAAAGLLARGGWTPGPGTVLITGNGRQGIAAAVSAFVPMGERLAVEALTYPVVKAMARRLGIELVPIETDAGGLVPAALEAAHATAPVRALYVQPTLHNPLGPTMPAARRARGDRATAGPARGRGQHLRLPAPRNRAARRASPLKRQRAGSLAAYWLRLKR
ncbi:hypothetical protein [Amycolatopsis sp. PS_44_ISF1]|uniref:hypothetical protein n=1 Tax=Amycolatopsis sp. PS_44_ISF1 TaxID=2974917 RepID=UPI0037BFFD5D